MAEDQDASQKTEEPTPKKIQDARQKGDVANSREVSHAFMLLSGTLAVALWLPRGAASLSQELSRFLAAPHQIGVTAEALPSLMSEVLLGTGKILLAPLLMFIVAALASGLVQNGFIFTAERMKPDLSKISVLKGLKRLFSLNSLMELLKGLVKITVVGAVALAIVLPIFDVLPIVPVSGIQDSLAMLHKVAVKILISVVAVVAAMAAADVLYQRFEHTKKLRMSKEDIKDENKQSEGDPHVKARLRAIRNERARQRMMQAVPTADVVITNPTHFAVALKYDAGDGGAPVLVAKGVDEVALRIRECAGDNDIPIVENPPLARALHAGVELDQEIQAEHYQAVAEIIAYVMGLNKKKHAGAHRDFR